MLTRTTAFALIYIPVCSLAGALGGDWPQLLGPNRNGISDEKGLLSTWPKNGPPVLWEKEVGEGFSAPCVAGDLVFLFHRQKDHEVLQAFGVTDGKQRWRFEYPCEYRDRYGAGSGPRSTPLVDGKNVYILGVTGQLHCLDRELGTKKWQRSLDEDYELRPSFFGVGTTPIIEGKLLIVNVGGKKAGIVALDKETGKEVWTATDHEASYSSPVAATVDGVRHVFFFTRDGLVSLDPENGKVRSSMRWRSRINESVNAANPLVVGNELFLSASYGTGAGVFKIGKDNVEPVWKGDGAISAQYLTSIVHEGCLYGFHGRHDFHDTSLRCVDWKTGKVHWSRTDMSAGPMVFADGRLIILTEDGDLVLVEASPEKYRELAHASVLSSPCRAQLALANSRLFARDPRKLVCWDLKK
jgi:outer membrane protein assembly factor BamB